MSKYDKNYREQENQQFQLQLVETKCRKIRVGSFIIINFSSQVILQIVRNVIKRSTFHNFIHRNKFDEITTGCNRSYSRKSAGLNK